MLTLDLREAAKMLGMHPNTLQDRAKAGQIPGACKPGRKWMFLEDGLIAYMNKKSPCPYTESETIGISTSPLKRDDFAALLGLPTRKRRRNITTG